MPQQAWSAKRERQYEHIKAGLRDRGEREDVAEEIAARTVNKERARAGEAKAGESHVHEGHLVGAPRWPAFAPRRRRADVRPAVPGGQGPRHQRPLEDEQAPAGRRSWPPLSQVGRPRRLGALGSVTGRVHPGGAPRHPPPKARIDD